MFYKPTYCCSCGDKIERIEWRFLTSRRFCELCETEYKFEDWLPRIIGAFAVVLGFWGIGSFFADPTELIEISNPKALASSRLEKAGKGDSVKKLQELKSGSVRSERERDSDEVRREDKKLEGEGNPASEIVSQPVAKRIEKKQILNAVSDTSYFCGAETKKGTPCSRKVKGKKRCWQHEGREAILPQHKLAVGGNR